MKAHPYACQLGNSRNPELCANVAATQVKSCQGGEKQIKDEPEWNPFDGFLYRFFNFLLATLDNDELNSR